MCFLSPAFSASQIRQNKLLSTPGQFSGALPWAHKKGFSGEGEGTIVIEEDFPPASLQSELGDLLEFFPKESVEWKRSNLRSINHSSLVIDTFHQIAPQSKITLIELASSNPTLSFEEKFKDEPGVADRIKDSFVINMSYLIVSVSNAKQYTAASLQKELSTNRKRIRSLWQEGRPKLLCQGAGNEALSLSAPLPAKDGQPIESDALVLLSDETLGKYTIVIGGLAQESGPHKYTNYPGENSLLQENFIGTLGENIRIKDGLHQGTSLSTPIVAGAALLLKEAYPSLSPLDVKEVLLESASRNFFIRPPVHIIKPPINGTFVYDPEDGPPDVSKLKVFYPNDIWKRSYSSLIEKFDPKRYGKGILDLRAAFIYGALKVQHPQWGKEKLRKVMKRQMMAEENTAATLIQSTFRGYKERKHIKRSRPVVPPSFIPLREPPEDYSLPSSPDTSPSSQSTPTTQSPAPTFKRLIKKKMHIRKKTIFRSPSSQKAGSSPKIKEKKKALA